MSVRLDCTTTLFVRCGKKLKLCSDGGESGSKKCKRGYVGACGRHCRSLLLADGWSSAVGFVLVRLAGILSHREDVYTSNLLYKDIL
jgi:hypothetical protein